MGFLRLARRSLRCRPASCRLLRCGLRRSWLRCGLRAGRGFLRGFLGGGLLRGSLPPSLGRGLLRTRLRRRSLSSRTPGRFGGFGARGRFVGTGGARVGLFVLLLGSPGNRFPRLAGRSLPRRFAGPRLLLRCGLRRSWHRRGLRAGRGFLRGFVSSGLLRNRLPPGLGRGLLRALLQ